MTKLIGIAFAIGLALLEVGKLREATYRMALLAAHSMEHDIISLGQLNKALYGENVGRNHVRHHKNH